MMPSKKCIEAIKQFEGLRLKAYLDAVGIPTIGYGATYYPDGTPVHIGDVITKERAEVILMFHVAEFSKKVFKLIKVPLLPREFDAIVSFAYNVGIGALKSSTLLKKVNADHNDPTIEAEFMKWTKAGGQELAGLVKRRQMEADIYFGKDER